MPNEKSPDLCDCCFYPQPGPHHLTCAYRIPDHPVLKLPMWSGKYYNASADPDDVTNENGDG
jgi:hypothetical protein